jgi:hypothetical protein
MDFEYYLEMALQGKYKKSFDEQNKSKEIDRTKVNQLVQKIQDEANKIDDEIKVYYLGSKSGRIEINLVRALENAGGKNTKTAELIYKDIKKIAEANKTKEIDIQINSGVG